jgi:alpha-tubulin suppressor-like RCC1 family protein
MKDLPTDVEGYPY